MPECRSLRQTGNVGSPTCRPADFAKEFTLGDYNTQPPRRPIAKSEGVRTERWKYIRYIERDPQYEQLFDLKSDPGEERNLATLAEHAGVLADMRAR